MAERAQMPHVEAVPAVLYRAHGDSRRRHTERSAYMDAAFSVVRECFRTRHGDDCACCVDDDTGHPLPCPRTCFEDVRPQGFGAEEHMRRVGSRLARWLYRADRGRWPGWKARGARW
jgi:hypothetical protein